MAQDPTPEITPDRLKTLCEIPFDEAPTPSYVVHMKRLEENAQILKAVSDASGAKILLALKGFACHSTFPLLKRYLAGTTSSGLHEGLLAQELFGKEVHIYSTAFKPHEVRHLAHFAHSLVFNSTRQLSDAINLLKGQRSPELGLRVNPEYSEVDTEMYAPCAPESRLGLTREALDKSIKDLPKTLIDSLDGLHFHALCEQDSDALEATAKAFEKKFDDLIPHMKWLNFGGGHHITRPGYDLDRLNAIVTYFREKYAVDIYLEPGEAIALHTGVLITSVVDIVEAGDCMIALLDTSATCHMPDILEMPYRANVLNASLPGENQYTYRLGGMSCLAGDIIGDYSFKYPLEIGQRIVFLDMAHYTMVKNTTFNGVPLPSICLYSEDSGLQIIRSFGYEDYRNRLS